MRRRPDIGAEVLRRRIPDAAFNKFDVRLVRDLSDYQMMVTVRAMAFMAEQKCPYKEEYDGNDLTATHLLAFDGDEPVATLRLRWFADFGKVERVCIIAPYRGSPVVRVLLAHAFEFAARKGYQHMIAQIQSRLWPVWSRMLNCRLRTERKEFVFSDYSYYEIDIPVPEHPKRLDPDADPYLIIRPEGDWDRPGVLESSTERLAGSDKAA